MKPDIHGKLARLIEIHVPTDQQGRVLLQTSLITLRTLFVLGLIGAGTAWFSLGRDTIFLTPSYISIYLTVTQDMAWLFFFALAIPPLLLTARHGALCRHYDALVHWASQLRHPVALIAFVTLVTTAIGSHVIYHAFPLSLDEYLAWFQARILLGGHILAPITSQWDAFVEALQPIFMRYDHANAFWVPGYRPLSAAIIAFFELFGLGTVANSFLATGSILLVALVAKRIWPQHPYAPAISALFLALSPQFFLTGMSAYAMTSHLFFNLLWLALFLRNDKTGHIGAALTGFIAIGLHQVHVHPFFILPFMLYLLKERRLSLFLSYGAWYIATIAFWVLWRDFATALAASGNLDRTVHPAEGAFFLERAVILLGQHQLLTDSLLWVTNFARFISWQNPAVLLGAYIGLRSLSDAPPTVKLMAWGLLTTLLPYAAFMPGQGHGWGYRYIHVALGSFAIISVHGFLALHSNGGSAIQLLMRRVAVGLLLLGICIAVPLRMQQVEHFIRPFALANDYISRLPSEVVIIDTNDTWFGVDLVRNDPYFRNVPMILASTYLRPRQLENLCGRYTPVVINYDELAKFGMRPYFDSPETREAKRRPFNQRLVNAGCDINLVISNP